MSPCPDLPEELIIYILTFTGITGLSKACALNRRFHSLLLSHLANTPVWQLAYHLEFGQVSHRELADLCTTPTHPATTSSNAIASSASNDASAIASESAAGSSSGCWRTLALRRARPRENFRRGGAHVRRLAGHRSWVTTGCLSWSFAVSAGRDARIQVWSTSGATGNTREPRATLMGHKGGVRVVRANERIVVSGGADRQLMVWNLRTGASAELGCHDASISCMDLDLSQQELQNGLVASGAADNVVRLWDLATCRPVGIKSGASGAISGIRLWDPATVVCGSQDKVIRIFDIRQPDHTPPALSLVGHLRKIFNLELLSSNPRLLLSESHSGQEVLVWDSRRPMEPLHRLQWDRPITGFGLSSPRPLGETISINQHQAGERIVGWEELRWARRRQQHAEMGRAAAGADALVLEDPAAAAVAPAAAADQRGDADDWMDPLANSNRGGGPQQQPQLFAVGLADGSIEVWDPVLGLQTHGQHRSPLAGTRSRVTCCSLQADGRLVATHADGRIAGWDTRTGANSWVFQPRDCGTPLCLAMNDSKLQVGTRSGTTLLFDFGSPLLQAENAGRQHEESSLYFRADDGSGRSWWDRVKEINPLSSGGTSGNRSQSLIMRSGAVVNNSG